MYLSIMGMRLPFLKVLTRIYNKFFKTETMICAQLTALQIRMIKAIYNIIHKPELQPWASISIQIIRMDCSKSICTSLTDQTLSNWEFVRGWFSHTKFKSFNYYILQSCNKPISPLKIRLADMITGCNTFMTQWQHITTALLQWHKWT